MCSAQLILSAVIKLKEKHKICKNYNANNVNKNYFLHIKFSPIVSSYLIDIHV